ncbi:hypothetical protein Tco_1355490, partial [Tanacetum coccineum]
MVVFWVLVQILCNMKCVQQYGVRELSSIRLDFMQSVGITVSVAGTQKKKHYVSRVNRNQEGSSSEGVSKDQQQNACSSHGNLNCVNSATE